MLIRPAETDDRSAIAAVQAKSWQNVYTGMLPADYIANEVALDLERQWTATELRAEDVVLVAEADDIVGFIAVWCQPDVSSWTVISSTSRSAMRNSATCAAAEGQRAGVVDRDQPHCLADQRCADFLGGPCQVSAKALIGVPA